MQRVVAFPEPIDCAPPAPSRSSDAFPALCQICLDQVASVTHICGPECLAEVCSSCFVQHLAASVYAFYPGVLPKVRCPVCLVLLNRSQWAPFVQAAEEPPTDQETELAERPHVDDNSHILEKFAVLCRQSCGFQSPCCHNADYSMLPESYADSEDEDDEDAQLELPLNQVDALPELRRRAEDFCFHRQDGAEFYAYIADTFLENAERVLWRLLPKILDEERRATLLLRHLAKNPDTQTRCCGVEVCFKCKATTHHNGNCPDFVEVENVVECRGCGVTVVMVDGCDSLRCLCGHSFSWEAEITRQDAQRKRLAPTDNAEYDQWQYWREKTRLSLHKIQNLEVTRRELRLTRFVRQYRRLLRRLLLPRLYRKRLCKKLAIEESVWPVSKMKVLAEHSLQHENLTRSQSVP